MKKTTDLDWVTPRVIQLEWISSYAGKKISEAPNGPSRRLLEEVFYLEGREPKRGPETKRLLAELEQQGQFGAELLAKMHKAWKVKDSRLELEKDGKKKVEIFLHKKDVKKLQERAARHKQTTKDLIENIVNHDNLLYREELEDLTQKNKELRARERDLKKLVGILQKQVKELTQTASSTATHHGNIAEAGVYLVSLEEIVTDEKTDNKEVRKLITELVSEKIQKNRTPEDIMKHCYIAVTSDKRDF